MNLIDNARKYPPSFYNELERESYLSAKAVLSVVFQLFDIKSVVDYGCGTGSWLRVARELGAERTTGIDGPWVRRELLVDDNIELITRELEKELNLGASFDLAISVEVAEHLPPGRADSFVREICAASRRIVFSAAIPGQGGTGHVNEQWQSYWAEIFEKYGFLPIDVIRPQVRGCNDVNTWYRNNTLLYVPSDDYKALVQKIINTSDFGLTNLDYVIPEIFERPGLRQSLRVAAQVPDKLLAAVRRRIKYRVF